MSSYSYGVGVSGPREDKAGVHRPPYTPSAASPTPSTQSNTSHTNSHAAAPPPDSQQQQHKQLMLMMRASELESPMYSYTSTGPINWKALWNALLSGQQNSLRKWVYDLPIKGCKVDAAGRLDVGASVIPPSFALQLNEMLDKAVPPLADLVIDALCWRGIFLPSELTNFDLLSIRLARNLLLLRPAGKREGKPLSLERFLPFGTMAPFHTYIITKRLRRGVYEHQTLRKTYITWYKLKEFADELDRIELVKSMTQKGLLGRKAGPRSIGHAGGLNSMPNDMGEQYSSEGGLVPYSSSSSSVSGSTLLSSDKVDTEMARGQTLGNFVQGYGYVTEVRTDGTPVFGSETEALDAIRHQAEVEEEDARIKIAAEIEVIQLQAAEQLVRPNFDYEWLKILRIPEMRVHPLHIHHDRVSAQLNDEIDAMLPRNGRGVNLLQNQPSDQILMLILYLIYKNSSTRAMRISIPLLQSNPTIMYRYLSCLVSKVAISSCTLTTKSNRRNQANIFAYLKQVQQFANMMAASSAPGGGASKDGVTTIHGLPQTQNYAFQLGVILDIGAILQRYMTMDEILNDPSLSGLLPVEFMASYERFHLPSLLWMVFDAIERRRNVRLDAFRGHQATTTLDLERDQDTSMLTWILVLCIKLYKVVQRSSKLHNATKLERSTPTTVLYLTMSLHFLTQQPFPFGFGEWLKLEHGGTCPSIFLQTFLWLGGLSGETPVNLVRRILQLHEEGLFDGTYSQPWITIDTDGREASANTTPNQLPLAGVTTLEHLCLVLAPTSAILLATRTIDEEMTTIMKPIWDATSEALLRVAYDPVTQNVLHLSNPTKASYLLSKSGGDEVLLSLAYGLGASSGDSFLSWLLRHHSDLLEGLPPLPPPGPTPPNFAERTAPLEKAIMRIVRCGMWYTLTNGFQLFAPHNVLHHVLRFLKYFTQRRYSLCYSELKHAFEHLYETSNLRQPIFGRHHFFAVVSTGGQDVSERNGQCFMWTQRMLVQMLRAGLLIGMQGNIPSSHRIANAKDQPPQTMTNMFGRQNAQGYSAIDLTDYDRNFLIDLFGSFLKQYGSTPSQQQQQQQYTHTHQPTFAIFTMGMMNDILSIIPPTVSSSFLLNITSLQSGLGIGGLAGGPGGQNDVKQSFRIKFQQHRYNQWKSRLHTWKEHELFYAKKLNEVTSLIDLELMVGISLDERHRFIRQIHQEMFELNVLPQIQAAIWYQMCQYLFKASHYTPDSLFPLASNSAIPTSSVVGDSIIAHQDPELLASKNFEHASELSECKQELLLLYLSLLNWQICLDSITSELDTYFRTHPSEKPQPKVLSTTPDGKKVVSQTEFVPALDEEGRPRHPPQEIKEKLVQQSQYRFVTIRIRGRIYWLMVLHGLNQSHVTTIEYDLNSAGMLHDWHARRREREQARMERETARMVRRATREANRLVEEATKKAGLAMEKKGRRHSEATPPATVDDDSTLAGDAPSGDVPDSTSSDPSLPPLPEGELDEEDALDLAKDADSLEEAEEDQLHPILILDFNDISKQHVGAAQPGAGGSITGVSFGLEKFHILSPSQYLPWNGSPIQNPSSAVADAQAKHRAISIAFDEDMDITRLTPNEIRLLAEYSIDTKLTLALVECLIHSQQFRSALCIVSDVLVRFPTLRMTPRMQAAITLCDTMQLLFWLAHPTLQDLRINQVLSGVTELPFGGGRTTLGMSEDSDPFARQYKELLAWPILPHMLREEDQTWLRMRWYGGAQPSNQTLMLQRLIVDSPTGSIFQSLLLSLFLSSDSNSPGVHTVYSRTRPVGVDIKVNQDDSSSNGGGGGGFANMMFGAMKGIGAAFKSDTQPGAPAGDAAIDVEHLREWLVSLDESARVELLDRFVELSIRPLQGRYTATLQQPGGLAGASANFGATLEGVGGGGEGIKSPSKRETHSLLKESFNGSFTSLNLRHLPLLCELAQLLAMTVRITSIELTKPRNKKLSVAPTPGVRITGQAFMNGLINVLVKTRPFSKRLPSTIPMHYASRDRPLPDENAPTTPWLLRLAENMQVNIIDFLTLTPSQLIGHLWRTQPERPAIATLLHSSQIYKHFSGHTDFIHLDRDLTGSDLSAALVEMFLNDLTEIDREAGPPSPFRNFQSGAWWTREDMVAFVGLADRTHSMALPTLAAAFRAQAFVIIRARDPTAAVSSSILAATDTAAGLLGWWHQQDESHPHSFAAGIGEFVRLTPGSMIEFELLHASYQCYLSAGRTHEMRQVASDIRSGLQSLLTSVLTKSKTPAPPIITSPTNRSETIPPPFAGASVEQIEHIFLARLQLERCARLMNNAETKEPIMHIWRQFRKKAPNTFA